MPTLDLNNCFPLSEATKTRSPLPKQAEFLKDILDPKSAKYIAYVGGIGSGKTMIGCITVLTLALLYPGDYLVGRQFFPELRDTTLKTFLEICPKELIREYRVADAIIKIRATGGKTSTIFFRQLEEPDKLRSMNLNAFYLDEASQMSESAFQLLQGRLRGPHVRKGFMTSNPKGHDWIFQNFVKQDFKNPEAKKAYKLIKAPSTENIHLADDYLQNLMMTWSDERVMREIMGSFDAFEGQVYNEFRRDTHVIKPFRVPNEWIRIAGVDHGYRNPSAWVWGAIDYDGNIYIYREYYQSGRLIKEVCSDILALQAGEKVQGAFIDPSTRARRAATGESDFDLYLEYLPQSFPLMMANNDKTPGIDKVKSYLKVDTKTNKPSLFIFDTCEHLIEEMAQYKYAELTTQQEGKVNAKEEPVKVNDHALDALRYLIMSRPERPTHEDDKQKLRDKYPIFREMEKIRNPGGKDPFGSNF